MMKSTEQIEPLDMNMSPSKKRWNLWLTLFTVITLMTTLFLPPDQLFFIVFNAVLCISTFVCCIIFRKKYKVGILIAVLIFCLLLIVLLAGAFGMNYAAMKHFSEAHSHT